MTSRSALRGGDGHDAGSLPVAVLLVVITFGLCLVTSTAVAGQQQVTRASVQRVNALNAAQTGIDVALAAIRTATRPRDASDPEADGSGDPAMLPCSALTGTVSARAADTYRVQIYYTISKPPTGDTAWAVAPANRWVCGTTSSMPTHAVIESTGTSGDTRTLFATYTFTTTSYSGRLGAGLVHAFSETGGNFCLSGPAAVPLLGRQLLVRTCNASDSRQQFSYQPGLSLQITDGGQRLCLDAGSPINANNPIMFRACSATATPQQQWGSDDVSAFYVEQGSTRYCLTASAGDTNGATVSLKAMAHAARCTDVWTDTRTFFTDPAVGNGKAGPGTKQMVNMEQFGRCVDVTGEVWDAPYLVVFPCKQYLSDPILWNQAWTLPSAMAGEPSVQGPISTTDPGGTTYCLTSHGKTTKPDYYIDLSKCNVRGTVRPEQLWTVYGDTGVPSTRNRITSTYQAGSGKELCMSLTNPNGAGADLWPGGYEGDSYTYGLRISKLILATCDATERQKWNGFTEYKEGSFGDFGER